ncbi:MAG: 5-methylcytosine-specific restriction endonuclease system specificity protein McrC [Alphaproteobacteria bacterium]|nr:5-methylcytosine-specific restriction endonuclease system specificity protein McrC [Alphaproteobacteria bacterium]
MIKDKSIYIKNIYYMLGYAFQAIQHMGYTQMATEQFDNIHDLFAAILGNGMVHQIKHGIYKEYINHNDDLPTVHGKINIYNTIRNKILHRQVINCDFDELSENNIYNQIIKTVIDLFITHNNVTQKHKTALKQCLLFLTNVDTVDLKSVRWNDIKFHRNNQTYRILINICYLTYRGLIQTTENGQEKLASFMDEQTMCRLYEKFILEYYKQEFRGVLKSESSQIPWGLDEEDDSGLLPTMQTDITLSKESANLTDILIVDAKYYTHILSNKKYSDNDSQLKIHSGNLYQIFTYVKNKEYELTHKNISHRISGMLLYAKTDEAFLPNNSYMMSGNRITVSTLDLYQQFDCIKEQLNTIVTQHFNL